MWVRVRISVTTQFLGGCLKMLLRIQWRATCKWSLLLIGWTWQRCVHSRFGNVTESARKLDLGHQGSAVLRYICGHYIEYAENVQLMHGRISLHGIFLFCLTCSDENVAKFNSTRIIFMLFFPPKKVKVSEIFHFYFPNSLVKSRCLTLKKCSFFFF